MLFFLWNPLVLWEAAGNGHNDVLMVGFGLLAILCLVSGRRLLVLPLLMLAALSKFVMVILVPLFLLALAWETPSWRARLFGGLATLALTAALAVGLYLPLWQGLESLGFLHRISLFTGSIPALVLAWLYETGPTEIAIPIASGLAFGLFGLFYAWQLSRLLRRGRRRGKSALSSPGAAEGPGSADDVLLASFRTIFVYLAIASVWFMPWYVVWALALAPLAGPAAKRAAATFAATALLAYALYVFVWVWNWERIDLLGIYQIAVPFVFIPPIAVFLRDLAADRQH